MNNLRELRERKGLKQAALAKELDVKNQASISEWETGRKGLSLENAIMFARYYGVTVGCIAGTEPIPDGFPDNHIQPVVYAQAMPPEPIAAEQPRAFRPKKTPFTQEQLSFLDEWGQTLKTDIADAVIERLQEDTSLLSEPKKSS